MLQLEYQVIQYSSIFHFNENCISQLMNKKYSFKSI